MFCNAQELIENAVTATCSTIRTGQINDQVSQIIKHQQEKDIESQQYE